MKWLKRLASLFWDFDVQGNPITYTGDDLARRNQYPELSDDEYNARFHPERSAERRTRALRDINKR
jgi:hypothetical protein